MTFNPSEHLRSLKGQQYLDVKWRLVWLSEECPHYRISTELIKYVPEEKMWIFKARVDIFDDNGQLIKSAEGTGQETEKDFPSGPCEKAETKALGRALAHIGFGTQFATELDEGDRVVDGPVAKPTAQVAQRTAQPEATQVQQSPISVAQLKSILVGLLAKDPEGAGKIPKLVEDMTEAELVKTTEWLRARASRKGV